MTPIAIHRKNNSPSLQIKTYGENAIVIEIDAIELTNGKTSSDQSLLDPKQAYLLSLNNRLRQKKLETVTDIVLGNQNLTIVFNPLLTKLEAIAKWVNIENAANSEYSTSAESRADSREADHEVFLYDALFDDESAPDLAPIAVSKNMDKQALVERICAQTFEVMFLGFQPGFAYLDGLPADLHCARRKTPRFNVCAGSIAIGGSQLGIYPAASPGGWQVIGRLHDSHMPLIDLSQANSVTTALSPGDRIKFRAAD